MVELMIVMVQMHLLDWTTSLNVAHKLVNGRLYKVSDPATLLWSSVSFNKMQP